MISKLEQVEARWYVMEENEKEAESIRPDWGSYGVLATQASSVDCDWADSIPFGGDDDKTCSEILAEQGLG